MIWEKFLFITIPILLILAVSMWLETHFEDAPDGE